MNTKWLAAGLAAAALCAVGVPLLAVAVAGTAGSTAATLAITARAALNIDALPAHARAWTMWILKAGGLCPPITAPLIAAQVEQESGWNPSAVAHNPPERGGDAMGLAQFQQGTWDTWGGDADTDGINSPFDAEDALIAQGRLMCDLHAWAVANLTAGALTGDPLELALAAYFCGRGCVLDSRGVPAGGLAHDYPAQVKDRAGTYTLGPAVGPGGWTRPLPVGKYQVGSGYGQRCLGDLCRLHAGVDLIARTATPVYAAAAGVVIQAECDSPFCDRPGSPSTPGCGYMITVNHGGGIVTRSCHLQHIAAGIRAGTTVTAGQPLGVVGSTGHSSGPHLHFEVHRDAPPAANANAVDPLTFMRQVGAHL